MVLAIQKISIYRLHKLAILLFLSCLVTETRGQALRDSIIEYFRMVQSVPQEKLYLHLDKPYYGAGENIWFQGYLQDAITHRSTTKSNYLLVELVNRRGAVVQRQKIRRDSIGFVGSLSLPADIPQGDYYLRGYSNWMLNAGEDFLCSRNLRIGNAIDVSVRSSIEYLYEDGKFLGVVRFTEGEHTPFVGSKVRYKVWNAGQVYKEGSVTTNGNGTVRIPLPDLETSGQHCMLDVTFGDPVYLYSRTFYLPGLSKEFDVTFFPEGGHLLDGVMQVIAFKAQGADGFSKAVSGKLYTATGDTLSEFRSEHDGMGRVNLLPDAGNRYFADVVSEDGVRKQIALPVVEKQGIGLALTRLRQGICYTIQKTDGTPWPKELYIVAHTRGEIRLLREVTPETTTGVIENDFFEEGITHFLLVDYQGVPLSERLCFVMHAARPQWSVVPDKKKYGRREKVKLQLAATARNGAPLTGMCSVSVTDAERVPADSLSDNILSSLLLTSDLKGTVENPGYYFFGEKRIKERHLDLVMLTHGWRRFAMNKFTGQPLINTDHYIEVSQSISGRVTGFWGKDVKKGQITAFALRGMLHQTTETNENGEFIIEDINFPANTRFVVQARTAKGHASVDILIDSVACALPSVKQLFRNDSISVMADYLQQIKNKYYSEGGIPVIHLKEVTVTGRKKHEDPMYEEISKWSNNIITEQTISDMGGQNIIEILQQLAGMDMDGCFRGSSVPPGVVLNGFFYEMNIFESLHINDIKAIYVQKGIEATMTMGDKGEGGAIIIELKGGFDQTLYKKKALGSVWVSPLGYSICEEFYHPVYDTPEKKASSSQDLRTTVFWNPAVKLDSVGKATLEYYTPDNSSSQQIVIEGVDVQGNPYRYAGRLY